MLQMSLMPKEGKCTLRFLFLTSWKSTHWRRVLRRMFSIRQDGGNQNLTVTRWNLICIYLTFQGNLLNLRLFVVIFFQRKSVRCVTVNLNLQSIFSFTKISLENRLWLIIHHCQKKKWNDPQRGLCMYVLCFLHCRYFHTRLNRIKESILLLKC